MMGDGEFFVAGSTPGVMAAAASYELAGTSNVVSESEDVGEAAAVVESLAAPVEEEASVSVASAVGSNAEDNGIVEDDKSQQAVADQSGPLAIVAAVEEAINEFDTEEDSEVDSFFSDLGELDQGMDLEQML